MPNRRRSRRTQESGSTKQNLPVETTIVLGIPLRSPADRTMHRQPIRTSNVEAVSVWGISSCGEEERCK